MVLTIIGYVLLAILIIIVLILIMPVSVNVSYTGGVFTLSVKAFGIKVFGFPMKKKNKPPKPKKEKAKKEKPKKEKENKGKTEKTKKPKTPTDILELVQRIAQAASAGVKVLLKGFWVRNVVVILPIGGDDAADIAITWGKLQGVLAATHGILENILNIQYKQVTLIPDFANEYKDEMTFSCKIVSFPVIILVAGIVGFIKFLRYKKTEYTIAEYVEAQKLARQKAAESRKEKMNTTPQTGSEKEQ